METKGEEDALTSFPNANAHWRATGKKYAEQAPGKEYGVDLPRGGQH